jgi:hypothetical protein
MENSTSDSTSAFLPVSASAAEAILDPSSSRQPNGVSNQPASPALACAISVLRSTRRSNLPVVEYSPPEGRRAGGTVTEPCRPVGPLAFRNEVSEVRKLFEVVSYSPHFLSNPGQRFAVLFPRNVGRLRANSSGSCCNLKVVVFESDSHLGGLAGRAFSCWASLTSIVIPSFVVALGVYCFSCCASLHSLVFESPSRLTTIEPARFVAVNG